MERVYAPISSDLFISESRSLVRTSEYHTHNIYEIYFFIKGDIKFYVESNCFHLKPGNIVLMQPQESHRVELIDKEVYTRFAINMSHKFLEAHSTMQTNLQDRLFNRPFGKPIILATTMQQREQLIPLFQKIWETYYSNQFGQDVLCISYTEQVLVMLNVLLLKQGDITIPNTMPDLVKQTIQYINNHLPNYITLDELSTELYHNKIYISRRFKEITGFSIREYILRKRIYLSQNYLMQGYSVRDSGLKAGFENHSNFTRTFSKYVGCTPKKYQKSQNKSDKFSPTP